MAMIGNYKVSSTRGKGKHSYVRVYRAGFKIAEVDVPAFNPLRYLRTHPESKHRQQLVSQLTAQLVPHEDIEIILTEPEGK